MPGVDLLHEAAVEYLGACAAALDALTDEGAPPLRFVSHGLPAVDCCPMLSVHVGTVLDAPTHVGTGALAPLHRIATTGVVNLVTLTATILRCLPATTDGQGLPPATLTAFAAMTNADLWAIRNWITARHLDAGLFGGNCRDVAFQTAAALTVEGQCAGWLIPIQLQVDGFLPDPA